MTDSPRMEHERRHWARAGELRNRVAPPDPAYPVPQGRTEAAQDDWTETLAHPLERLASTGVCRACAGSTFAVFAGLCLRCRTGGRP